MAGKAYLVPKVKVWWPDHSRGLFEGDASPQQAFADLRLNCIAQVTSASLLTLALNFRPRAVTTLRIVSKLGLRSPDEDKCRIDNRIANLSKTHVPHHTRQGR